MRGPVAYAIWLVWRCFFVRLLGVQLMVIAVCLYLEIIVDVVVNDSCGCCWDYQRLMCSNLACFHCQCLFLVLSMDVAAVGWQFFDDWWAVYDGHAVVETVLLIMGSLLMIDDNQVKRIATFIKALDLLLWWGGNFLSGWFWQVS